MEQKFNEIVQAVVNGTVDPELIKALEISCPPVAKLIKLRATFLKKSKVQQAVIMKKMRNDCLSILLNSSRTYFSRKKTDTKLDKVRDRYYRSGCGFRDWKRFVNSICAEKGIRDRI